MCKKRLNALSFFNPKVQFRNENGLGDEIYFRLSQQIRTSTRDNRQRTVHLGSHVEDINHMREVVKLLFVAC